MDHATRMPRAGGIGNLFLDLGGRLLRRANLPAFTLAFLLLFDLLVAFLLLAGSTDSALGRFARDFQAWCFRADPATGRMDWFFPAIFFGESLLLAGVVWTVWGADVLRSLRRPARLAVPLTSALLAAGLAAWALAVVGRAEASPGARPAFPGADLRTAVPLPAFSLVDHLGRPAAFPDPDGHVTLLTAFYAHCVSTCPAIFSQVAAALDSLDPELRARVRVAAITMDPGRDTPERLKERAEALGFAYPEYRLLTGDSARVEALLDRLDFARAPDTATGEIRHANLMLLADAEGRVAFRFTLGETQADWMAQALSLLAREAAAPVARSGVFRPAGPARPGKG